MKSRRLLHLLVTCLSLSLAAHAQVDRSGLTGTVTDAAGRLLPDARIVATEVETHLERTGLTSSSGAYDLPELPVGTYSVRFEHAGFASVTYTDVIQTVGRTRTLNASMNVSGGVELLKVSNAAIELNQTSDALGARIEPKQVQELPLNGRNWSTLTALVPGAVDTGGSNQRSIRFAGRGLDDNNFTYDGIDATNIVNQAQQPFVRLAIPTDSIQEFRIDTMLFTAENGSTPGGQVAVVSRTGGNAFHGNLFEFLRNDIFDARGPFGSTKLPFRLNQYGGSLGGPIAKDKTFFFFTYEGLRQVLTQPLTGFVPSAALRAQVLAASPALAPILAAYPTGSQVLSSNPLVAQYNSSGKQVDHEDSAMIRLDHRFSSRDTADLRFNYDTSSSNVPLAGAGTYTLDRQQVNSRPANGVLEYLHLFSSALVNEAKFGFNRGNVYTTNRSSDSIPYAIAIGGSGITTLNNDQYKIGVGNSYSYIDNLTWVLGRHTLKFGTEVRRIQLNQGNTANGTITYPSLNAFIANQVSSVSYAAPLPVNGLRKTALYSFAQDEWKLSPELTLNLGLRYTFFNNFHEVLGRAIPFDFGTCGSQGFCGAGASFGQANTLDLDPRVSVAWAPTQLQGKTVFRGGFGMYHGDGQLDDQNLPISNEVPRYNISGKTNVSYPVDSFLTYLGVTSPRDMDRLRKDSYVSEWGLSIQQELGEGWVTTVSYNGSKGTDLLRTSYLNLINPATGTRPIPNPVFGQVEYRGNNNSSSFEAFVFQLRRSFSNGLLFQGNYEWAHEIDQDAAGGGDSDFPENPACFRCERASGDFDARNVVSGNVVYELPFGRNKQFLTNPGIARAILGDWQVSSIFSARTGLPVNVTIDRSSTFSTKNPNGVATGYTTNQRPNRVAGVSIYPASGSGVHNWLNPAAFAPITDGTYGNAPRNLARAPGLWQSDMGLAKNIPVTERVNLQFRSELFNIFNRAQYGAPLADYSTGTFGAITNPVNVSPVGTGTPRQVQFLLRAQF